MLTTWIIDADFATFMAQVDDIHQQAVEIEKVAHALDEYSRHLGNFGAEDKNHAMMTNSCHRKQAGKKDQYHGNYDYKRHLILITPFSSSSTPLTCLDRYLLTTSLYIFIHLRSFYIATRGTNVINIFICITKRWIQNECSFCYGSMCVREEV